jgi:hypothetical protein
MPWDNVGDTSDFTRNEDKEKEIAKALKRLSDMRLKERERNINLWKKETGMH